MSFKKNPQMSFSSYHVERRKTKKVFLQQINKIIDWPSLQCTLERYYTTGQSDRGRKAYPALVLFKMTLLQTWYNLSDYGVEEQVNDSLSCMRFCGLQLEDEVPDHSVVCRFRKALNESGAWDVLLDKINSQLTKRGVLVKPGAMSIIDASITPTPRKPHGKSSYALSEEPGTPPTKEVKPSVDQEAAWVKKCSKLQYGYKRHYLAEGQEGLVLAVHTTSANAHDSQYLEATLRKVRLPKGSRVLADKGYCAKANEALLHSKCLRSGIQRKAYRNRPLTNTEKRYNKLVGKVRYKIERVFGSIKRWFGRLEARYVGLAKTHGQHVLEAMAYNLYRLPGIIMSMA
jgi:transposase, IS5 family